MSEVQSVGHKFQPRDWTAKKTGFQSVGQKFRSRGWTAKQRVRIRTGPEPDGGVQSVGRKFRSRDWTAKQTRVQSVGQKFRSRDWPAKQNAAQCALDVARPCVLDPLGSGGALGTLWKRSGMLWEHSGDALGMLWGHSGNVLGAVWGHSGETLGTLWGRSGTLSVSISISTSISISISTSISNPDVFFIGYLRRFHWLSVGFCFTWLSRVWVWPPHRAPILLNDFVAWLLVLRWS